MTLHAFVQDGEVVRVGPLPRTARLADGRTVSGFDRLPTDVLAAEGWLPCVEDRPDLGDGEQHGAPTYTIGDGQVTAVYPVEAVPQAPPDPLTALLAALADAQTLDEVRAAALNAAGG